MEESGKGETSMKMSEIFSRRLANLLIQSSRTGTPNEAVHHNCAIQAQDYWASVWAIGLRSKPGTTVSDVEKCISEGEIVRSWLNRGTIHFSAAGDMRWLLSLFYPGLKRTAELRDGHLGLSQETVAGAEEIFRQSLLSRRILKRSEMYELLESNGLAARKNNLGYHMLYRAAWDGIICFGPLDGGEQTFVLAEQWITENQVKTREDSISELARRYFESHGPATVQDFVWWSGIRASELKVVLDPLLNQLESEEAGGRMYYYAESAVKAAENTRNAYLIPAFDEYIVGYRDRSSLFLDGRHADVIHRNGVFLPAIVINGEVVGTWKARSKPKGTVIEAKLFRKLEGWEKEELDEAASEYGNFFGNGATIAL